MNLNNIRYYVGEFVWVYMQGSVRHSVKESTQDTVYWFVFHYIQTSPDSSVSSVWFSVRDSAGIPVENSVDNSVWDSVDESIWDPVWNSVFISVRDPVWNSVRRFDVNSIWHVVNPVHQEHNIGMPHEKN